MLDLPESVPHNAGSRYFRTTAHLARYSHSWVHALDCAFPSRWPAVIYQPTSIGSLGERKFSDACVASSSFATIMVRGRAHVPQFV